jgi:phosphoserine phosphatase RsbU/P
VSSVPSTQPAAGQPPPATLLHILVVEDNPDHADLIRLHLTRSQEARVVVQHAERLSEGFQKLDGGGIDAVLLDMMLPDSTGMETVSRMHAHAPAVPIVVLTSAEGDQYGIEAVHYGADDYIFKGRMDGQSLIRSIRYAIERSGRRKAESALDAARQELRIAQAIQEGLYPRAAPPLAGFDIAGASQPAESVGGDYFDYVQIPDGRLMIAIGDVSGHGIGPALLMAETRAALRTLSRTSHDMGEALTLANHILLDGLAEGRFITLLIVALDPSHKTLTWASAGHPDGLVLDRSGQIVARLSSGGVPLGVLPDERYPTAGPVTVEPGQTLVLVTDGVLEASPPGPAEPFGAQRLIEVVQGRLEAPAAEILEALQRAVVAHSRTTRLADDVTAIIIKAT